LTYEYKLPREHDETVNKTQHIETFIPDHPHPSATMQRYIALIEKVWVDAREKEVMFTLYLTYN